MMAMYFDVQVPQLELHDPEESEVCIYVLWDNTKNKFTNVNYTTLLLVKYKVAYYKLLAVYRYIEVVRLVEEVPRNPFIN